MNPALSSQAIGGETDSVTIWDESARAPGLSMVRQR
jgi:hypothetical protein